MIGLSVKYCAYMDAPLGAVWIRLATPARAEELRDLLNGQVWYGREINAGIASEDMHVGRERGLEKGRPRYFRDVWHLPPRRESRRRNEPPAPQ